MKIKKILQLVLFLTVLASCTKEDLEPSIEQQKNVEGGITSTDDLKAILDGAYNRMTYSDYYGRDFIIYGEVRTDNTYPNGTSGRFTSEGEFKLLPTYGDPTNAWEMVYKVIASSNIIINAPDNLEGDKELAKHYKGQAYAMRALAHFDLLKLFGQQNAGGTLGIPYVKEYKTGNLFPSRNTVEEVKNFVIEDLKTAKSLMNVKFNDSAKQNITSYVPDALLSRVYLYFGMNTEAELAAKSIIDSGAFSIVDKNNFVTSFATESPVNAIFSLAYSPTDNTGNGSLGFIYRGKSYGDIQPLDNAINLFEAGDVRGKGGIIGEDPETQTLRNMGKYVSATGNDDICLIRYEEIVLNYAEALVKNGKTADALTQLNSITSQRGASPYTVANIDNVLLERRKELMFEGFRFDDLMRNKKNIEKVDNLQKFASTIPYGDPRLVFPIPQVEMDANSNMVQNKDY